jgi:hypothetical protein
MLLYATGWSPEVLDGQPDSRIENYLLFVGVKNVIDNGGELRL